MSLELELSKRLGITRSGRKDNIEYQDTIAFIREYEPKLLSLRAFHRIDYLSKSLSFLPVAGRIFEPPKTHDKLTPNVNLKAAFDVIGANQAKKQALFDSLRLGEFQLSGVSKLKVRKILTFKQFSDLLSIARNEHLNYKPLTKVLVHDTSIRDKRGNLIDLNFLNNKKINVADVAGSAEQKLDKLEKFMGKLSAHDQQAFLSKCRFKNLKMDVKTFEKLDALAQSHGLDAFKDLKVNAKKIMSPRLTNQQLAERIVEAVKTNSEPDLKLVDLRGCNIDKAFDAAKATLTKQGISTTGFKLSADSFRGSKMTGSQKVSFNNLLATLGQPAIDNKSVGTSHQFIRRGAYKGVSGLATAAVYVGEKLYDFAMWLNYSGSPQPAIAQAASQPQAAQPIPQPNPQPAQQAQPQPIRPQPVPKRAAARVNPPEELPVLDAEFTVVQNEPPKPLALPERGIAAEATNAPQAVPSAPAPERSFVAMVTGQSSSPSFTQQIVSATSGERSHVDQVLAKRAQRRGEQAEVIEAELVTASASQSGNSLASQLLKQGSRTKPAAIELQRVGGSEHGVN